MPHGGWVVLAAWNCAPAYQRPGFGGRRLVGRIRCFFLRKKAEPLRGKCRTAAGWVRLWCFWWVLGEDSFSGEGQKKEGVRWLDIGVGVVVLKEKSQLFHPF